MMDCRVPFLSMQNCISNLTFELSCINMKFVLVVLPGVRHSSFGTCHCHKLAPVLTEREQIISNLVRIKPESWYGEH